MRTPKRCLIYDSTRNFHYQIDNTIMPDRNYYYHYRYHYHVVVVIVIVMVMVIVIFIVIVIVIVTVIVIVIRDCTASRLDYIVLQITKANH